MIRVDRFSDGSDADARHWDELWQSWDAATIDAAVLWEGMLPVMLRWFPAGAHLVEAGCGTGKYCVALRQRGYRMTGIDYSRAGIAVLQRIAPSACVVVGSVLAMPFADGEFGGALSLGVVEHFEEGPAAALAELARVVRPGGRLFLTVPLENWFWERWQRRSATGEPLPPSGSDDRAPIGDVAKVAQGPPREHVFYQYLHRRSEIGAALARAGFRSHGVRYFGRQLGLEEHLAGLSIIIDPRRRPVHGLAAAGLRARLKRAFPRVLHAMRAAERTIVEHALPGPLCAHTICFLAVRE
jgi:SAM-dependent methyltransferase